MNKTLIFILTLIGSGAVLFLIFYLYPAEIFDVEIIGVNKDEIDASLCLETFLFKKGPIPEDINAANISEIKRSLSGWMILFICVIGLPTMIAYRVAYTSKSADQNKEEEK